MTFALIAGFLCALVINVPIAIALGFGAILAMLVSAGGMPLTILAQGVYSSLDSILLTAVPFFILAGNLMAKGGVTARLVRFANNLVGGLKGGLAMVAIVSCVFFAGMTGSGVAEAAALGILLIPSMAEAGYPRGYATCVLASAGSLGIIIPPSIPMVIYSSLTETSVGRLFLAGFLPGILIGAALMVSNYIVSSRRGYKGTERASPVELLRSFRGAILPLFMPLIIVGGIYGGIFTPTESAVAAVLYALFLGTVVYRQIHLKDLPGILVNTAVMSSVALFILSMAYAFGLISTLEGLAERLGNLIISVSPDKFVFLLWVNFFFLFTGCFMPETPVMIITMPIFLPAILALGIDPIHFGIIFMLNHAIGMMTPPYGVNIFVTCSIAEISESEYMKYILPFIIPLLISLGLVTYIPEITLFLPKLLSG